MFNFSPWAYDTSEESSVSVLVVAGGSGTLYFKNGDDGSTFSVPYQYGAISTAKGAAVNFAKSVASTWSQGTNVFTVWGDFGTDSFPCDGYFLLVGATAGIFSPSFFGNSGLDACLTIFNDTVLDSTPKAAVLFEGAFDSILPSAGLGLAYVTFSAATSGGATADGADGGADGGGGDGSDGGSAAA